MEAFDLRFANGGAFTSGLRPAMVCTTAWSCDCSEELSVDPAWQARH